MSDLYRRVELKDGEPVQFVGIYVLKTRGINPDLFACGFVEAEEPDTAAVHKSWVRSSGMGESPWKGKIDGTDVEQAGKLIDSLVDRIAELETTLRDIQVRLEIDTPTSFEAGNRREVMLRIIAKMLGEETP